MRIVLSLSFAELLMPYVSDTSASSSMELSAIAGLAMGMVQVGSSDEVCAAVIADRLMESNEVEAGMAIARHLALGLGLLFLGRGEAADAMLEVVSAIESPLGVLARILLKSCAYAGTGDVLCAQELLRLCAAHPEAEDKEKREKEAKEKDAVEKEAKAKAAGPGGPTSAAAMAAAAAAAAEKEAASPASSADVAGKYVHQSAAVLGLALVSMGEEMSVDSEYAQCNVCAQTCPWARRCPSTVSMRSVMSVCVCGETCAGQGGVLSSDARCID